MMKFKSQVIGILIVLILLSYSSFVSAKRDIKLAYNSVFKTRYLTEKTYLFPTKSKVVVGYSGYNMVPILEEKKFEEREVTGFVFDSSGHAIIPFEPLRYFDKLEAVFYDKKKYPIKIIGTYPPQNIALVKLENYDRKWVTFGDSDKVEHLDEIWAYGFHRGASKILSSGIISSSNYSDLGNIEYPNYIKSDMSINPGVSTAPVFNSKNEVIGICRGNVENFGVIEPINNIKPIIEKLKSGQKITHGWMGIYISRADSFSEKEFNIDIDSEKIYVAAVFPGTPAEEAGVQKGDIIISVNNNSHTDVIGYIKYMMELPPQSEVSLKISRNSKEEEFKIKTVDKPYSLRLSPLDELHLYFGLKVICKNGKPYIENIREDSYADGTFLKAEKYIKYYLPKEEFPVQELDAKELKLDNRLHTKRITNCKMLNDYITNSLFDDILIIYIANGNFLDQGYTFVAFIQDYFPVI